MCPTTTGLCLTLITSVRHDHNPDQQTDFPAWSRPCLIAMTLSALDHWLDLAAIPRCALLVPLGWYDGPRLARPLPQWSYHPPLLWIPLSD